MGILGRDNHHGACTIVNLRLGSATADIRELYLMGEHVVAGITAGLTFGLPIRQESSFTHPTDEALQSLRLSAPNPNCRDRHARRYRLLFAAAQTSILLSAIGFNCFAADFPPQPFWSCPAGTLIWHVMFVSAIPVVGLAWLCALCITYRKSRLKMQQGEESFSIKGNLLYIRPSGLFPGFCRRCLLSYTPSCLPFSMELPYEQRWKESFS
jgi:hypothetical protein